MRITSVRLHPAIAPLVALAALAGAAPAAADEQVALPTLDRYRFGQRSLLAADADETYDGMVTGGLSVGPRWSGDWSGPFTTASIRADLGVSAEPFTHFDLFSDMDGRWAMGPSNGSGPGGLDLAGHHGMKGNLSLIDSGGFFLDLAPVQTVNHATSSSWGMRAADVAPEWFIDQNLGGTLWLSLGSREGPDRPTLQSLGLTYDLRATYYQPFETPGAPTPRKRLIHRVSLAAGLREHDDASRLDAMFLVPSYVTTDSELTAVRWHRFDYEIIQFRLHGVEVDDLSGYAELSIGGSVMGGDHIDELLHTSKMNVAFRLDAPDLLDFGIAGGHEPGFDPAGRRALGITSFEANLTVDPTPHHYGMSARGRIDRFVELEEDIDDQWRGHISGELYTRIFGMQLGSAARGSHGSPTGSMGWDPFSETVRWSAYVGGFLRGEACFSARCDKQK